MIKLIKRRRNNGQIKRREEGRKEETKQDGKGKERSKKNEEGHQRLIVKNIFLEAGWQIPPLVWRF
jgi:hypothetical protein